MHSFWKLCFGSAGVTAIRTLCAFVVNKVLAVLLGPAALALVGQFQNIIALGQGVSSLALQNAWVSLTAQNKDDKEKLLGIWRGGYRISVYALIAVSVIAVLFMFFAPLQQFFPGVPKQAIQAAILFMLPGIAATNITLACASIMNGLGAYRRWAIISLGSSVFQAIWVIVLLYTEFLSVLSVIATQSILSIAIALPVAKGAGFKISDLKSSVAFKMESRIPWLKFAAMGLLPMILSPIALTVVRSHLGAHFGWQNAGLWQGVYKISDFFSVAISSALGVVLLPKISAKMNKAEFKKTFYPLLLRIMVVVAVCVLLFVVFRSFVIALFLSTEFASAENLLQWQLIGDFFRAGGWCCAMVLIARQQLAKFMVAETFFTVFFVVCTMLLTIHIGIYAPTIAYAAENLMYFITTFILVQTIKWESNA